VRALMRFFLYELARLYERVSVGTR